MPFQPPMNRPRPMPPQLQPMMNTGWRDAYQSFRQDQQRPVLPGFYISSPQDIAPRDVPMDGSISFFPSNDLSYIIIKQWTGNGTIADAKYVLDPQLIPTQQSKEQTQTQSQPQSQVQQTPDQLNGDTEVQNSSESNSEIVEVISAALNEQTQRLTAAFAQIGSAFTILQKNLDDFSNKMSEKMDSVSQMPSLFQISEEQAEKPKCNRPKGKELKENEKPQS